MADTSEVLRNIAQTNALNIQNWDTNTSRNALVSQYGPAYANPQMAQQAEAARHQQQMTPIQVEAGKHANVLVGEQAKQAQMTTQSQESGQSIQQVGTLLSAMGDAASAPGADVAKVFDSGVQSASQILRVPPEKFEQYREDFVKDPAGTTERLARTLGAGTLYGMTPKDRGAFAEQVFKNQKTAAEIDKDRASTAKTIAETQGGGKIQTPETITADIQGNNFLLGRVSQVPQVVDQMKELIPKFSNDAATRIRRATAKWPLTDQPIDPNSAEYKFTQLAHQLGGNLSLEDLRNTKASGTSFGRVTNTEFLKLADAILNPNLANVGAIKNSLAVVRNIYGTPNEKGEYSSGIIADLQKHDAMLKQKLTQAQANPAVNGTPAQATRVPTAQDLLTPGLQRPQQQATGQPTGTGTVTMPQPQPIQQQPNATGSAPAPAQTVPAKPLTRDQVLDLSNKLVDKYKRM